MNSFQPAMNASRDWVGLKKPEQRFSSGLHPPSQEGLVLACFSAPTAHPAPEDSRLTRSGHKGGS